MNLLRKWGHRVTLAGNGAVALDCLARHRFDVILMDVQMPVMDGLEATRRYRLIEQRTAHTLKGTCAIFNATPMIDLARRLEALAGQTDWWLEIAALADSLEAEFNRLARVLDPFIP